MSSNEKMMEIIMKIVSGNYTKYDEAEDICTSIAELTINNSIEKEKAKLMIKAAREMAEKASKDNI